MRLRSSGFRRRNARSEVDETGVIYNPFADRWSLSADMDVNYMVTAEKTG